MPADGSAPAAVPPKGSLAPNMQAWVRPFRPGPLSEDQLNQFFAQGYTIARGLLSEEDLQPAIDSINKLMDDVTAKLIAAGKITDSCADVPFEKRLIAIEKEFPNAAVLLHKMGMLPMGIAKLWSGPKLLGVAKQMVRTVAVVQLRGCRPPNAFPSARLTSPSLPMPSSSRSLATISQATPCGT